MEPLPSRSVVGSSRTGGFLMVEILVPAIFDSFA
jgi:hypothetical protein